MPDYTQKMSTATVEECLRLSADVPELATELRKALPALADDVMRIRSVLETAKFVVVNARSICNSREEFRKFCRVVGVLIGGPVAQNAEGETIIEVYDR